MFKKKQKETFFGQYVVVTPNQIVIDESLHAINTVLETNLSDSDFRRIGSDFIVNLNEIDLDFVRDAKKLANIYVEKLHKKKTPVSGSWLEIVLLIMVFITMVKA